MHITGPQQGQLKKAITQTFGYLDFKDFMLERMDMQLDNIAAPINPFAIQVSNTITHYNQRGTVGQLISALIAERSSLTEFQQLAYSFGLHPEVYTDRVAVTTTMGALESLVNSDPLLDIAVLIQRITDNKKCVCRIKVVDAAGAVRYGTGFLVGDDRLLTNYHVMEPVINNPALAAQVVCKFDYEMDGAGVQINPGKDYGLHLAKPVEAYSPTCAFDIEGTADVNVAWPADCLDYALVKLADKIGSMPYGINADKTTSAEATLRGWIQKPSVPAALFMGSNVIIVQHPDKLPMKIAIGLNGILGTDDHERRVRYKVNTMEGSSGSPCFDHNFNWIALHNMGDPNYGAKYNQGIPAARIIEDLLKNNITL